MSSPLVILLVDDSPEDAELVELFARRARISNPIVHVSSGQEALDYLAQQDPQSMPGLVLLDVRMPGLSGHETLERIRSNDDPAVRVIPVVMLTQSHHPDDVLSAYSLQANSYVVKPPDAAGFQSIVTALTDYWFTIVKLPRTD